MRKLNLFGHLPVTAILSVLLLFFSCSKDNYTPPFTSAELKLIPYAGNDSITYTDSLGNMLTLIGSERGEYNSDPSRQSSLKLIDNSFSFPKHYWQLLLSKTGRHDEILVIEHCEIDSADTICGENFILQIVDEQLAFGSDPGYLASSGERLSSITFGNRTYSNVFKINQAWNDAGIEEPLMVDRLYYNAESGIICFQLHDGEKWYLK